MSMVNIKGYDFKEITIRDSYNRRALQYQNKIIGLFKKFGLSEDDVDIVLENNAMRKAQASVSWYMLDEHLFFSYNGCAKYVENLAMVSQVIEFFLYLLSEGEITREEFIKEFEEDHDVLRQRKEAREVLGVDEKSTDFEEIHKKYKLLAKEHHPDIGGDTERFQKINAAHKILKRELNGT